MFRSAIPRVTNTIAISAGAGAAASVLPSQASADAYHHPESLSELQGSTSISKHSSNPSNVIFSPDSSFEGWDFITGGNERATLFGSVPTKEESEDATRYVLQSLHDNPNFMKVAVNGNQSAHSYWPEAVASMASSEEAMLEAQRALQLTSPSLGALTLQEIRGRSSIVNTPLHEVMGMLQKNPKETQEVVESLASDKHVWNAINQNPAFLAFMEKSNADRFEEESNKSSGGFTTDSETYLEENVNATGNSKKTGLMSFFDSIVKNLGVFCNSCAEMVHKIFSDQGNMDARNGEEPDHGKFGGKSAASPTMAALVALVIMVIGVIMFKRVR